MPAIGGAGGWIGTMMAHCAGATVVALEGHSLDAHELWSTAQREKVTQIVIVGDAFARPLIDQLAAKDYDVSSLRLLTSGGAILPAALKRELIE